MSLAPNGNPLIVTNGVSQAQGSVSQSLTSGAYPATSGSGQGAKGTYTITVSGHVISEQYALDIQFKGAVASGTDNQDISYLIQSSYDIVSGVQSYSYSFTAHDVIDESANNCVATTVADEVGSISVNWNTNSIVGSIAITPQRLAGATQGISYSQAITATGGTQPYSWSATGLPTGLAIDPITGIIAGTPTQSGQFTVTVNVNDSAGASASKQYQLTVTGGSCQVNVNPLWSQADKGWANETYNNYSATGTKCVQGNDTTDCKIRALGCSVTTLAMALKYAGANVIPGNKKPLDPGSLNEFMRYPNSYFNENHDVLWDETAHAINSTLKYREDFSGQTSTSPLDQILCQNYYGKPLPVIVGVDLDAKGDPGHFVLVTGKEENGDYQIADPGDRKHNTLHATDYFVIRGVITDPSSNSALDLSVGNNAELLAVDGSGRRTGYDVGTGEIFQEIPASAHFIDSLRNDETGAPPAGVSHSVDIFQPLSGTYSAILEGVKLGTFSLSIHTFASDGTEQTTMTLPGIVAIGSKTTFEITYVESPGVPSGILRVASFPSILADITNSLALGLIDNAGVANALSAKIDAASSAAARGDYSTAANALNAFENQVSAQTDKHINGVAPQVLQEDAKSLLSQI